MNREKQIEEMAFNLIMATSPLGVKDLTKEFDYKTVATDLYDLYGWCKASDVAREIINKAMSKIQIMISAIKSQEENGIVTEFNGGAKTALEIVLKDLAELKKKYIGEDTNVTTNTEGEG